mgnify:CR=1 FL=1|jgi:penicillin amidase
MFKKIVFIFLLLSNIFLIYLLNNSINNIPPLGKFLNPYSGFWINGEIDQIKVFNKIKLKNLDGEVIVQYDSLLIPHIYAETDKDLFYTQGYLTALHRLWQMEFQIKGVSGELSEIFGKRTLDRDRSQRRKGIVYAAKKTLKESKKDPKTYKLLNAYVDGVNDYIESLSYKDYPIEYKILDYKPKKWTLLECFLLMEQMSDMLSRGEMDIEDTYLINTIGEDNYNILFPEYDESIEPIIPKETKFNFENVENIISKNVISNNIISNNINIDVIKKPNKYNGSNNFAISPNKTKDGSSYLASQPDLSLNLPSIWYIIHLNSPNFNTMGASLPGAPGIIIGFNDNIAWGETNAKRDLVDWYKIEYRDSNRNEYKYSDKWLKTEKIIEKIIIKDENPFYDTVIYTHYGPVVYDKNFNNNGDNINLAMRWIAHDESIEYKTFLKLNMAKNINDIHEALKYFDGPAQNFAYATNQGDIGLTIAGKFPIKWEKQGKFILDGSNPEHEWRGRIPYEHILNYQNPKNGFVSSANQHPVDKNYPYYYYDYSYENYRNRRLNDRLKSIDLITIEDVMKIQNDNFSYKAFEILPVLLSNIDTLSLDTIQKKYLTKLKKWDYFSNTNIESPSIFVTWWNIFRKELWDEFDTLKYNYRKPSSYNTYMLMKKNKEFKYYDILKTKKKENLSDLINYSYKLSVDSLENWKNIKGDNLNWKDYKNTTIRHLLKIKSFSKSNIAVGGYSNIINAASESHGPSWRMIVKLNKTKTEAWGIYPGGQSGNPGNKNYFSLIDNWGQGVYKKLLFNKNYLDNSKNIIYEKKYKN